jgi:L-iditol 2-dehydrogenase
LTYIDAASRVEEIMKSVLLRNGKAELTELPTPELKKGEILVKMQACGLCGTDLEKLRGEYTSAMPVLGHEPTGIVADLYDLDLDLKKGDKVFAHHHVGCGECHFCRSGSETMCQMYKSSNIYPGGFSEYFKIPAWNVSRGAVLKLPDSMPFEVGALIEPTACCIRGLESVLTGKEKYAFVAGCGPVGLTHIALLRQKGITVFGSDVSRKRLDFAEELGASAVFEPGKGDVVEGVRQLTSGRGADISVVASGNQAALSQAISATRRGGRVLLFGVPARGSKLDNDLSEVFSSEISILTSYGATERETVLAMEMLAEGKLDLFKIVSHRIPLADFERAVELSSSGEALKIVIVG